MAQWTCNFGPSPAGCKVHRNLVTAGEVEVLELGLLIFFEGGLACNFFEGGLACNIRIH